MSHTTSIKAVKIQSITALRAAIAELQSQGMRVTLAENIEPRHYYTRHGRQQEGMGVADFVVQLPDADYDVGLYKQPDGSYEPRSDFWGQSVEKVLGVPAVNNERAGQAKLGKLLAMYGIHAVSEVARRKGQSVRRIAGKDGAIQLEITGPGL